jgi:uncharacterized protein YgiB involved in biofilm formation
LKKSHSVALVLLAGISAVAAFAYLRSSGEAEETVISSLDDCTASYDEALCRDKFAEAKKLHESTAPQYGSEAACEQTHGEHACVAAEHTGDGSIFIPAMVGFMAGRMLSSPRPFYYGPDPRNCASPGAAGCPSGSTGSGGHAVYSGHSYVGTYQSAGRGMSTVTTAGGTIGGHAGGVGRGGFGASANAHGGGGGE